MYSLERTEMEKLYKNGLVIGRFAPLHIGHNKLINESIKRCEKTLVLVGSAQESGTLRNPLPLNMRINLIRQSYPGIPAQALLIRGINDLKNELNNDFSWGKYVKKEVVKCLGVFTDLIIYGNDPKKRTWFNPSDIPETYELFVPRDEISGTYVRGLIVINDEAEWKKVTIPYIHNMYDEIRNQIMSIPVYQDIYAQISSHPTIENFMRVYKKFEEEDYAKKLSALNAK